MDRIAFFGGAVFIPVFLVSVGLILDPAVIVKGETVGLAARLHRRVPRRQGRCGSLVGEAARILPAAGGAVVLAQLRPGRGDRSPRR